LNAVFEEQPESCKVRCLTCLKSRPLQTNWIDRRSSGSHLKTIEHERSVAENLARQHEQDERERRMATTYSMANTATLNPQGTIQVPSAGLQISSLHDSGSFDILMDYDLPEIQMVLPHHDARGEAERQRRELVLLLQEAQESDALGLDATDNDETLTNVIHEMRNLGTFVFLTQCMCLIMIAGIDSNDGEDDGEDEDPVEDMQGSEYYPYGNKIVKSPVFPFALTAL
jgi:hypothetical protein